MSKFNKYAKELDRMAREAFDNLAKAEQEVKSAENAKCNAKTAAARARADADYIDALATLKIARGTMESTMSDMENLRKSLVADVDAHYSVNPAALDANTMELLKSGIMKSSDYSRLLDNAKLAHNHTMARMIGKYAAEAAELEAKSGGKTSEEARNLRAVAYMAGTDNGKIYVDNFDSLRKVYSRCVKNNSLIRSWDELTADAVNEF